MGLDKFGGLTKMKHSWFVRIVQQSDGTRL
jgi:hypothetical protein